MEKVFRSKWQIVLFFVSWIQQRFLVRFQFLSSIFKTIKMVFRKVTIFFFSVTFLIRQKRDKRIKV